MVWRALWLVCGAIACGAVGLASASPQFASTFAGTYSAKTPNTSSGLDALATWSDPAEPGGKPKEIQKIKVLLNPGSRLDTSALPACKASDEDVQIRAVRACPVNTKLGEVRGQGVYAGSAAPFNTFATLFNARGQIIVVVTLDDKNGRLLTNFRDDVGKSSITVNLKIGRGISLVRFQAHVPAALTQEGRTAAGLLHDSALVSARRCLDHDDDLQLQGRLERPAHGPIALHAGGSGEAASPSSGWSSRDRRGATGGSARAHGSCEACPRRAGRSSLRARGPSCPSPKARARSRPRLPARST